MNKGEVMSQKEFMKELNDALQGEVSKKVQADTLEYYGNYIKEEVKKGTSEQDVLSMLGSGRIIAKSIIEVHGGETEYQDSPHYDESTDEQEKKGFHQEFDGEKMNYKYGHFTLNSWYGKALIILAILMVVMIFVALIGAAFSIFWRILPAVLIVGLVLWLIGTFSNK